jgi:outer membrane protein assembly factor BamD
MEARERGRRCPALAHRPVARVGVSRYGAPRLLMRWPPVFPYLACAALMALCACENEPAKTALGYTENAKRAYEVALDTFNAHQWIAAQTAMREVKRKYSYSKYARLAELRIADADYEQEKFTEAIHEYKDFIRSHRSEEEDVSYARSRVAEATYAEIPESFLMPASEERDQAAVLDAYKELRSYVADYPAAKPTAHLRELIRRVTARLVRHELYVARFYLARDNYEAAVARIDYALHTYSTVEGDGPAGGGLLPDALLLLGETYLKMHKWREARQAFEAVLRDNADTPNAIRARHYLGYLAQLGA